jgi:hypothetical protein
MTATAVASRHLTEAQRRQYQDEGFLLMRGLLSPDRRSSFSWCAARVLKGAFRVC